MNQFFFFEKENTNKKKLIKYLIIKKITFY